MVIPSGKVGLATVCSVAVNGVLLKAGVPVESRFGGVLEIRNSRPRRFTAIINYAGTSLDPSEQYMRASMTSVGEAARTGNGRILANFRELPAPSRATVEETVGLLKEVGINGVYVLGQTRRAGVPDRAGLKPHRHGSSRGNEPGGGGGGGGGQRSTISPRAA